MPCDRPVNVLLYLLFYYCAKLHLLYGREYAGVQTFPVDRKHSNCSKAPRNPQKVDLCVLASFSCRVYAETQGRKVRPVAGLTNCLDNNVTRTFLERFYIM